MSYELDEDTAVETIADGAYRARVSGRYSIGHVPNGGYVLALALAAAKRALPLPDPLVASAYYVAPAEEGEADLLVDVVKLGKRFATAEVRLVQGGKERTRVLTTFGALASDGVSFADGAPPRLPPIETCVRERPVGALATIGERLDMALDPSTTGFLHGEKSERAELRGYVRFADGRPFDVLSLAFLADAFPPPVFHVVDRGWVPTLELTVQLRARPAPSGYLRALFRTRFIGSGLLEEDGELWDETGTLVALSRQTAILPRPR